MEIAQGMSKTMCNHCNTKKEKGRKTKNRKAVTPLKKSYRRIFKQTWIR